MWSITLAWLPKLKSWRAARHDADKLAIDFHPPWRAERPTHAEHRPKQETQMALRKFIIEREIPKVGTFDREQLRGAAAKSNEALRQLGPDIQWIESFVADNKTFCVYLAADESIIRKHEQMSGFPASKITEVRKIIDPTTERPD